jgi:hypothetical protein
VRWCGCKAVVAAPRLSSWEKLDGLFIPESRFILGPLTPNITTSRTKKKEVKKRGKKEKKRKKRKFKKKKKRLSIKGKKIEEKVFCH